MPELNHQREVCGLVDDREVKTNPEDDALSKSSTRGSSGSDNAKSQSASLKKTDGSEASEETSHAASSMSSEEESRKRRQEYFAQINQSRVPLRKLPSLIKKSARFVWTVAPRFFIISVVLQIVNATGAAAQLLAARDALTTILNVADSGGGLMDVVPSLIPIAVLAVVRWLTSAVGFFQQGYVSLRIEALGREKLLEVVDAVDLSIYEGPDFYEVAVRAMAGAARSWSLVSGTLGLFSNVMTIVAVISTLYVFHPLLVPLVALAALPTWFVNQRNALRSYDMSRAQIKDQRMLNYLWTLLMWRFFAKEVHAYNLGPGLRGRWRELNQKVLRQQRQLAIQSQIRSMLAGFASSAISTATIGFALWLSFSGRIATGTAGAALYGIQRSRGQFGGILGGVNGLYTTSLYINDYETFLELGRELMSSRSTLEAPRDFSELDLEEVCFAYPGIDGSTLHDISLKIKAGEVVALVGENGSGKTTLAKVIANLYFPTSGRILRDGVDAGSYSPASIRRSIAFVFQDFVRYDLSAAENIGFGNIEKCESRDDVAAAAQLAGADRYLEDLPDGYDTILSRELADGRDLSVGQWQRVAIARAFFRDANFIILDEPTAALDARAEHDLFERIRTLCKDKTVLLISHRFSSVRSADRIVVLDGGRIVETGSHDELMAAAGLYAELFNLQAAAYLDSERDDGVYESVPVGR